jgi:hypothetical protein
MPDCCELGRVVTAFVGAGKVGISWEKRRGYYPKAFVFMKHGSAIGTESNASSFKGKCSIRLIAADAKDDVQFKINYK